jgi:threonine aldolase
MREAIARADVGDDTLGRDPTVRTLESRIAELLGKEDALFFPSGIMANETALLLLGRPGTEAIVEATSHFVDWEMGAPALLGGLQLRAVHTPHGLLSAAAVEAAIRPVSSLQIRTSVISIENTHNAAGGRVLPLETCAAIHDVASRHGLPVHLDGARLWNASVAAGVPEHAFAQHADTVTVTLSKGLGCPVGSLLAGTTRGMEEARRIRRRLGGGMRQAGLLAAAGLYALDHHRARLPEDHTRAATLAGLLTDIPGIRVVPPETNIIVFDLATGLDAGRVVEALEQMGVLIVQMSPRRLRAVTHLDIDDAGIARAATAIRTVLARG